jgi:hypothetical protein
MKHNRPWLMAMCLVGMGSVFVLPVLGISFGTVGSLLLILLCPLSHVLIMWGVFNARKIQAPDATIPRAFRPRLNGHFRPETGKFSKGELT